MHDQNTKTSDTAPRIEGPIINASRFAESYASFNRVINGLQRQYIELKEEFSAQNEKLAEANRRLMELTESNLTANQFLNGILDAMPLAVVTVDRNERITHINPAGSVLFTKNAQKSVGMLYAEVFPDSESSAAGAVSTIQTGRAISAVKRDIIVAEGKKLKLSMSTALLKDESGNCAGALEVFQDLTKLQKMEQEIARLNTLAALGEMAATIAHEVRNPLSGIGGFAALLERDIDRNDPKAQLIQKIKKGVENLNSIVTKLLNYTRFNELNRREVDFVSYLKSSIEQFRLDQPPARQAAINLIENGLTAPNAVLVSIDMLLFRQCLFNLMMNSIDATDQNPEITFSIRMYSSLDIPPEFDNKINLDFDESLLVTSISDNGRGIRPEHRDKIFAPFFTTKGGGSGLGLAVAWKLTKAHGGDIILGDSSPGGTTFHILLPAGMNHHNLETSL